MERWYLNGLFGLSKIFQDCGNMVFRAVYRMGFDETKYMSFPMKYNELLENCNGIWEKVKNIIKEEFESEAVYNGKHLRTK